MDVDRGIRVAVDTGDVTLGSEKSIQSLKLGKGQLVVVAANAPKEILEDVEYYANLSQIPSVVYEGYCCYINRKRSRRFYYIRRFEVDLSVY